MPVTRSKDVLTAVDGLFYLDGDTIELVSFFHNELKSIIATYGEDCVSKLIPHITSLMKKLNDLSRENSDKAREIDSIRDNLRIAESRCSDLDTSFKDKSIMCCELEDQYDNDIERLNNELASLRLENRRLQERFDQRNATEVPALMAETDERISELEADRRRLLTTVEVLEADIKCLRCELRRAETRARQRRTSAGDDLLLELRAIETTSGQSSAPAPTPAPASAPVPAPTPVPASPSTQRDVTTDMPTSLLLDRDPIANKHSMTKRQESDFKHVLIIGDSHLRHSTKGSKERGAYVECLPGHKILDIKNVLLSYVGVSLSVIYMHVGCNNLKRGYQGGPGYNGGHGKRQALDSMADLLFTARTSFPDARIVLNSVLIRRDLTYKALHDFNDQVDLMANNFGVVFVEANTCVDRRDLVRDGVHFKRSAMFRLDSLIVNTVAAVLASTSQPPSVQKADLPNPPSSLDPVRDDVPSDECLVHTTLGAADRSGN